MPLHPLYSFTLLQPFQVLQTRCKLQNCALQVGCEGPFPAFLLQETAQNLAEVSSTETARFLCQETALAPVGPWLYGMAKVGCHAF